MPSVFLAIFLGTGPIDDVGDPKKARRRDLQRAIHSRPSALRTRQSAVTLAVTGEIAEDMELARRFKRDGRFRIALAGSEDIAHTRMYRSFGEIWRGFEKNFALGVRGEPLRAAIGLLGYACLSPLSPIALALLIVTRQWPASAILAASMACGVAAAICCMRRMRLPLRWGFGCRSGTHSYSRFSRLRWRVSRAVAASSGAAGVTTGPLVRASDSLGSV